MPRDSESPTTDAPIIVNKPSLAALAEAERILDREARRILAERLQQPARKKAA
jgi:hypothetical protein